MKPPDSPGSFSETESDVSSVSSFDNAHTPVAATAYPPQPQEASIEADLYQKFSNEAAAAARPTPRGPTWTQRRGPSAILAASATLLALVDVLCCTSPELAKSLFAYSWEYKHDNKKTTVYIGVFARVVGKKTQAIMSGNWGGSTSASYLQTWFFCQLVLLLLTLAASAGVAFAPHPREDATLRQYRHLIRAAILLMVALIGVPWTLLATLASTQINYKIGYFAVFGQGVVVVGTCFGLFLASRLERDEDWVIANQDAQEDKRNAKMRERQRRAQFKREKTVAIALAKQRKAHNKVMAEALGKEGQRALLLRQMMDTSNKPKAARTGGSNALSAATGSFPRFGTQAGWGYPQQPPPVYQPQPQWGGYGGGYY